MASPGIVSGVVWTNHQDHIRETYREIYETQEYTDCILMLGDGGVLHANSTVLSLASALLERLFAGASLAASTGQLAVSIPDVTVEDMQQVLLFIHTGEVNLVPGQLSSFVEACSLLELRGIKGSDGSMMGLAISGSNIVTPNEEPTIIDITTTDDEPQCLSELSCSQDGSEQDPSSPEPVLSLHGQQHVTSADEKDNIESEMNAAATVENSFKYDSLITLENYQIADQAEECSTNRRSASPNELKMSGYSERLSAAIDAMVNGNITYSKAAQDYNVSKTVLWRRAYRILRNPKRFELPPIRRQAMEAIKAGATLLAVSRQFDIPLSTLHRDKNRLYKEGRLPGSVIVRQRKIRTTEDDQRLLEAAQHSLNGTLSLQQASEIYSLSRTSVWRKVQALKDPTFTRRAPTNPKKMPNRRTKQNRLDYLEERYSPI